ncbi:hypothetical protein [Lysobacter sp. cf310]|uniref:hypothetical protein n=1 Tax=Lysobacter sp. cf310 TaxID=1761790 RepID=UPI0008E3E0FB|nr:hypothetical protein [Lysobacter sp. cf310]SFK97992.1 hypothetical protein SAMN04487938_2782 [Lysobacter sp. cf310]
MKRMNLRLATALAAAVMPLLAAAAPPGKALASVDTSRPQPVIEASAECSRRQDWLCLARLMDPVALKDLRELLGERISGATPDPRFTAMFDGKTPEQIKRLDDSEFFAAFMAGTLRSVGGVSIESLQVVGGIPEGEDQYHAVTRAVMRSGLTDTPMTMMDIVSLRRIDGRWRLQLKGDVRAMIEGLRRMRAQAGTDGGQGGGDAQGALRRPQLQALQQRRLEAHAEAQRARAALEAARQAKDRDGTETERDAARD